MLELKVSYTSTLGEAYANLKHECRAWHMLERVERELGLSKAPVIDLRCQ